MSKELESINALKAMNQIYNWFELDFQPIETALKEYEQLKLAKEYKDINNFAKLLKALEIIKEKVMPLVSLDNGEIIKGHYRVYDNEFYGYKELTKEEYDLLEEVLS